MLHMRLTVKGEIRINRGEYPLQRKKKATTHREDSSSLVCVGEYPLQRKKKATTHREDSSSLVCVGEYPPQKRKKGYSPWKTRVFFLS
jgi:hypothetical protein